MMAGRKIVDRAPVAHPGFSCRRVARALGGVVALLLATGVLRTAGAAEFEARLAWVDRMVLSTPLSGVVRGVHVSPGDRVAAGSLLVELDGNAWQAAVKRSEAEVVKTREDLAEAERELERARELFDRTVMSSHDLQLAEIAHARARAAYDAAVAGFERARLDLRYSRVEAPFEAKVLAVQVLPGSVVVSRMRAQPLVVVARAGVMAAVARILPDRLPALEGVREVEVEVNGKKFRGEVRHIALEPDTEGGYAMEVRFQPDDSIQWRAGLPARLITP